MKFKLFFTALISVNVATALEATQLQCSIATGVGVTPLKIKQFEINSVPERFVYLQDSAKVGSYTYNYYLSFNKENSKFDLTLAEIHIQGVLLPGQKVSYTIFDGFGGPEPELICQRGGTLAEAPLRENVTCKAVTLSIPEEFGQLPKAQEFAPEVAPLGDNLEMDLGGNALCVDPEIADTTFLFGRFEEHVLPEIHMNLVRNQSVSFRKGEALYGYVDYVCQAK